jgi:hypothetical protein
VIPTTGGLAPPAADCNAATAATVAEVPYTANLTAAEVDRLARHSERARTTPSRSAAPCRVSWTLVG